MIIGRFLPFIVKYIENLDESIQQYNPSSCLSRTQKAWLSFCIMAILITNSVCWAQFERIGNGKYALAALSWIFRRSPIPWEILLSISARLILKRHGIATGTLVIDDSEKKRSKMTRKIHKVHKTKDKSTGGYFMGQSIVFLVLITPKITIPISFFFYMPDPQLTAWKKEDEKLKKQGVPAKSRPDKPVKDEKYPTKIEIALKLLKDFKSDFSDIKVKCILADALYGSAFFMDTASALFGGVQVISQIRNNQKIKFKNKEQSVERFFTRRQGVAQQILIRGDEEVTAIINSARMHVCSHGKKRLVIALKYEGEKEYRYLVAFDLSWRALDIVQAYTFRWLVEVFLQDWKANEGWDQLTKHTGAEGSCQGLILSLLVDHCLFLHPDQLARLDNKLPAFTVGSLREKIKMECLIEFIRDILNAENPEAEFNRFEKNIKEQVICLTLSKKHMVNRDMEFMKPLSSSKYIVAA